MANGLEVAASGAAGSGVALRETIPVGLTPSGLVATGDGWLMAAGEGGSWAVSQRPDGGMEVSIEQASPALAITIGEDGTRFSIDSSGRLLGWSASGPVTALETGLTTTAALEAAAGWVVVLTNDGAFAQPYEVTGGEVSFAAAGSFLGGRFGSMAVSGTRVALGSGLEVAWYRLAGGWQFGGRISPPAESAGVVGVRWSDEAQISVMDLGAGLWRGDTATGAQRGTAATAASAGLQSDSPNGLFGGTGLVGWRSDLRGVALWYADIAGTFRLGTLDATRPGAITFLPTHCAALQGGLSPTSVALATGCGVSIWRHLGSR